jgi:hypothetical protein
MKNATPINLPGSDIEMSNASTSDSEESERRPGPTSDYKRILGYYPVSRIYHSQCLERITVLGIPSFSTSGSLLKGNTSEIRSR